jgi:hypothetical protein
MDHLWTDQERGCGEAEMRRDALMFLLRCSDMAGTRHWGNRVTCSTAHSIGQQETEAVFLCRVIPQSTACDVSPTSP